MGLNIYFGTEDAEDCCAFGERYAFAFDGLGGSGSHRITMADGQVRTEALIAAQAAARSVDAIMAEHMETWTRRMDLSSCAAAQRCAQEIAREIEARLMTDLRAEAQRLSGEAERLPTTVAGWIAFPVAPGRTLGVALWAGDSRCYAIDAQRMRLYSRDDSQGERDAMEDCLGDSLQMSNLLSLGNAMTLHCVCQTFAWPTLLMAATDGFYKGVPSPMHLEYWFRRLGEAASFEEMSQAWQDFSVGENHFDDDSATVSTLFLNGDPGDVSALRALLSAPMATLRERYIEPFPEDLKGGMAVNVSDEISGIARKICQEGAPYRFHDTLRENARRWATTGESIPDGMPCAVAVKQARDEFVWRARRRREQSEADKKAALQNLKDRVERLNKWEPFVKLTPVPISRRTEGALDRQRYWEDILRPIDRLTQRLCSGVNELLNLRADNGGRFACRGFDRDDYFDFYDQAGRMGNALCGEFPGQRTKMAIMGEIDQDMVDLCACLNRAAEDTRAPELKNVLPAKPAVAFRKSPMTLQEQETLIQALLDAAANGRCAPLFSLGQALLPMEDMLPLVVSAAACAAAERDGGDEDGTAPAMQSVEDHLARNPTADARFVMETLYKKGSLPAGFRMPEKMSNLFASNAAALHELRRKNEALIAQVNRIRQEKLALWARYKPGFECWNEALRLVPPKAVPDVVEGDARCVVEKAGTAPFEAAAYDTRGAEEAAAELKSAGPAFTETAEGPSGQPRAAETSDDAEEPDPIPEEDC